MLSTPASFLAKRFWLLLTGMVALSLLLSACGFKLKQAQPLPFTTLYTNISENSAFGSHLRRILSVNSPNLRFVSSPEQAEVQLIQDELQRYLRELSLDPYGQVESYELKLELVFSLVDQSGQYLLAPTRLVSTRDIPNNPNATDATSQEINTLFHSMEMSLVDRLLRRLTAPDVIQAYENSLRHPDPNLVPAAQPPASATSF